MSPIHKLLAEFAGTAILLMVVVGSGIAGDKLAGGNVAIALLANSIATGAGLYVLISVLGPISGAQFNPIVSLYAWLTGGQSPGLSAGYIAAQMTGGVAGVWLTHLMYELPMLQYSATHRSGGAQWLSEWIASVLLLGTIHLAVRYAKEKLALIVALLVTGGYWFTSSTFFANPAVTIARSFTNTFAGIYPGDVAGFIAMQLLACACVVAFVRVSKPS